MVRVKFHILLVLILINFIQTEKDVAQSVATYAVIKVEKNENIREETEIEQKASDSESC